MINGAVIHRSKIGSRVNLISTSWWHMLAGRNTMSGRFGQLSRRWPIIIATMGKRIRSNPKEITVGNGTTIRQKQHRTCFECGRRRSIHSTRRWRSIVPSSASSSCQDSAQTNFDGYLYLVSRTRLPQFGFDSFLSL